MIEVSRIEITVDVFDVVDANRNILLVSEHATDILYNIYYQSNRCSKNSHIVCKLHPFDDEGFQEREADNALFSKVRRTLL